jgi:hypothetical protein
MARAVQVVVAGDVVVVVAVPLPGAGVVVEVARVVPAGLAAEVQVQPAYADAEAPIAGAIEAVAVAAVTITSIAITAAEMTAIVPTVVPAMMSTVMSAAKPLSRGCAGGRNHGEDRNNSK